jgi:hypothetical protein
MHKTLLCAAFATAFLAVGGTAQSAMQKANKPSVVSHVEPVVCVGDRRNYRNFDHCMQVLGSVNRYRVASYCSRICAN